MPSIIFFAEKKNGQFKTLYRDRFGAAINELPDGKYTGEIKRMYKQRSTQQNRAKFGIAYKILHECMVDATGESLSIEYIHEFCKERFLPAEYVERLKREHNEGQITNRETGEVIILPFRLTTTKMTTVEEIEYYKNMQKFAAEFFYCEIHDPDHNWKLNNENHD